jgi:HK97 family phage major capsid protein
MAYGDDNVIMSAVRTAGLVPTLWSDEIFAAHKKTVVLANLVRKLSVKGKKGDSIKLPRPSRGTATAKAADTIVTTLQESGDSVLISINSHYHYARLIEDVAEVQALASMRKFYTDDAGYSLGVAKDTALFDAAGAFNGGTAGAAAWAGAVLASDGTTAYVDASDNAATITDAGIRRAIQFLDDNDIPMNDRYFVIPPVARRVLMGLARFTEQAFTGEAGGSNPIRTGKLGNIYGIPVYVSSNCPTTSGASGRICLLAHKDAMAIAEMIGPRVQFQYKLEYLATLLVADNLFGAGEIYNAGGIALATTA